MPLAITFSRSTRAGPAMAVDRFDETTVAALARALSARPYQPPPSNLPARFAGLGYDAYRAYRYRASRALWRDLDLPFQAQFFHRGFLFEHRVDVFTVQGGQAARVPFSTRLFDYPAGSTPDPAIGDIGFAGFRLFAPFDRPDRYDEFCSFLGASYFRAIAPRLGYGLSARGLALGTGEPGEEEFPRFTAFWLEQPAAGAEAIVVHALLDGPSAAGAFRFRIAPGGATTVFDVDARLYPRTTLANAGIAPLTSMFHFDGSSGPGIDDFRPAVHDSDGLALLTGGGELAWRQLRNHRTLQHSGFQDSGPAGFGLVQRKRAFHQFSDTEARYDQRPSLWVEPVGDWGAGEVHLVEIPTADEYQDNVVAFWRPRAPLAAGREHRWRYRLHWGRDHPWRPELARATSTRIGRATSVGAHLVVIDFSGDRIAALSEHIEPRVEVASSHGEVRNAVAYRHPEGGDWRLSFELHPGATGTVELRARLLDGDGPLTETWLYRWTA